MNRQQIVAIGLVVVLVGVLIYQFGIAGSGTPTPAPPTATTTPAGTAAGAAPRVERLRQTDVDVAALMQDIQQVRFDYATERIDRNPMAPLVGGTMTPVVDGDVITTVTRSRVNEIINKRVTGIIWDPVAPVAVVDDEVVYPGYVYPTQGGAPPIVVAGIEPDRVIFRLEDTAIPVELQEQ